MRNISKTIRAAWNHPLVSAVPVVAGLLAFTAMVHTFGAVKYMYSGFTDPFAKGLAVVIFLVSIICLRHSEGRLFVTHVLGALTSGAILASPFFMPYCVLYG